MKTIIAAIFAFLVTMHAEDVSRITPADKEEAARLMKIYRENTDQETREKAVSMLLNMHQSFIQALAPVLEKDWQTALTNYRAAIVRTSAQFVQKKLANPAFTKEVKLHRDRLAQLRATAPRKEQLEAGLGALGRLRGLHTVAAHDLIEIMPTIHDMAVATRALTRMRAALKLKVTKLQNNTDFSEEDLDRELAAALSRAFWSTNGPLLNANAALAAKKVVPADEAEGVRAVNEVRLLLGLSPCMIDPKLHAAARDHSKDMATLNFFSEESPAPGKKTMPDRAKLAGTVANAETIAKDVTEVPEVIQQWFVSPEYHLKMLGNWRRIGVGRHESYWTALFGE